jgi:hypothetical protein
MAGKKEVDLTRNFVHYVQWRESPRSRDGEEERPEERMSCPCLRYHDEAMQ